MGTAKRERQKANKQAKLEREAAEQQVQKRQGNTKRFAIFAVVAVIVVLLFLWLRGGGDSADNATASVASPPSAGETLEQPWDCPAADGSSPRATDLLIEAPTLSLIHI